MAISIHAPHTGRDGRLDGCGRPGNHFNPRAPYGARHRPNEAMTPFVRISIHAPHTGRDFAEQQAAVKESIFQSTRPIRGATMT